MTRHKHADLIHAWAEGAEIEFQYRIDKTLGIASAPDWDIRTNYRIKPTKKTIRFYNYIDHEGNIKVTIDTPPPSALWIGEEQNVEI